MPNVKTNKNLSMTKQAGTKLPLYKIARDQICQLIKEQNLSPGDKLPSIRTLSNRLGIARATMAKAVYQLSNDGILDSKMGQGIYVSSFPDKLIDGGLGIVYCCVAAHGVGEHPTYYIEHNAFWSEVLFGIREIFAKYNNHTKLRFSFLSDFLREKESVPRERNWREVAFIILGDCPPDELQKLLRLDTTILAVHSFVKSQKVSSVCVDCKEGGKLLTNHLIELGHKKIGYCGTLTDRNRMNYSKYVGFSETMRKHGLQVNDEWKIDSMFGFEEGYRAMKKLIGLPRRPTAVIFHNDETAIGAMRACFDEGLSVPNDISIASFDNAKVSHYVHPSLTTIAVKMREQGRLAAMNLLNAHETGEQVKVILKPELILRESTGAVPV